MLILISQIANTLVTMFLILICVAFVLVAVLLYLPYSSGLVKYEKNVHRNTKKSGNSRPGDQPKSYGGYVPPDEQVPEKKESLMARASAVKDKMHITADDMPVKIKLANHTEIRRRKDKLDIDRNPNNYDYDIDELINESDEAPVRTPVESKPFSKEIV